MSQKLDLLGKRFGKLVVLKCAGSNKHKKLIWKCACDCGGFTVTTGYKLTSGHTKSCGCYQRSGDWCVTHGASRGGKPTQEYAMLCHAKSRASKLGIPFNIELSDIVIPEFCPVFPDIVIGRNNTVASRSNSPSLDKLIPSLGYVKGNVRVISYRANSIKQDASWQEILSVANWVKLETENKEQI